MDAEVYVHRSTANAMLYLNTHDYYLIIVTQTQSMFISPDSGLDVCDSPSSRQFQHHIDTRGQRPFVSPSVSDLIVLNHIISVRSEPCLHSHYPTFPVPTFHVPRSIIDIISRRILHSELSVFLIAITPVPDNSQSVASDRSLPSVYIRQPKPTLPPISQSAVTLPFPFRL